MIILNKDSLLLLQQAPLGTESHKGIDQDLGSASPASPPLHGGACCCAPALAGRRPRHIRRAPASLRAGQENLTALSIVRASFTSLLWLPFTLCGVCHLEAVAIFTCPWFPSTLPPFPTLFRQSLAFILPPPHQTHFPRSSHPLKWCPYKVHTPMPSSC